jgi:hypothetical protein
MATIAGSKKATEVRKLFKLFAHSFSAVVHPQDNLGARPRRSSRRDIPLSFWYHVIPLGSTRRQHADRRVASAVP